MADELLNYIRDSVDRIEGKLDRHDDRINDVEKWQANAAGKVTMLAAVFSALGGFIMWFSGFFHK